MQVQKEILGAIIAAGVLDTAQIRIANIIKEINRDEEPRHNQAYVSVINNEIQIQ